MEGKRNLQNNCYFWTLNHVCHISKFTVIYMFIFFTKECTLILEQGLGIDDKSAQSMCK